MSNKGVLIIYQKIKIDMFFKTKHVLKNKYTKFYKIS